MEIKEDDPCWLGRREGHREADTEVRDRKKACPHKERKRKSEREDFGLWFSTLWNSSPSELDLKAK